jgi:hypothetical protein
MTQGNAAGALITSMFGFGLAPPVFRLMPRRLLEALTRMSMRREDKKAAADAVTMRKLAPTVRYEGFRLSDPAATGGCPARLFADTWIARFASGVFQDVLFPRRSTG